MPQITVNGPEARGGGGPDGDRSALARRAGHVYVMAHGGGVREGARAGPGDHRSNRFAHNRPLPGFNFMIMWVHVPLVTAPT